MKDDFIFYIYGPASERLNDVHVSKKQTIVVTGLQEALDWTVKLTKEETLFAVYKVGDCVGDFS